MKRGVSIAALYILKIELIFRLTYIDNVYSCIEKLIGILSKSKKSESIRIRIVERTI